MVRPLSCLCYSVLNGIQTLILPTAIACSRVIHDLGDIHDDFSHVDLGIVPKVCHLTIHEI